MKPTNGEAQKIVLLTKLNENDSPNVTYSTTQIIKALAENAGVLALAAKALGCERATLWYRCKKNPGIMEIVEDYREAIVDYAESGLRLAVLSREPWAIQFTLKMKGSKRGYSERHEITGKDGEPIGEVRWSFADRRNGDSQAEPAITH